MKMTIRLVPLLAAACFAAAACEQQSGDSTNNDVAANTATGANDTGPAAGGDQNSSNVAVAAAAGGGVPTGGVCGGIAGAQCSSAGDFCQMPTGQCQVADAQGTCTTKPEVCTEQYDPVCGCDGKTYGNACEAARAGVNVQSAGECRKP